jgi:hypothetical protein
VLHLLHEMQAGLSDRLIDPDPLVANRSGPVVSRK